MTIYSTLPALVKKIFITFIFIGICAASSYAQVDTVVLNNQKIACLVKEITPDAVKYVYPGEEVVNSVYKNTVQRIIFKSGRVQTFAESASYKSVKDVMDYENISVTTLESEVQGLYKLGDVSAKAKGTTVYANQERVKERAYRKFKIEAAMLGANVVLLTNQRTEGNKYGYYSSNSAETNLTGIAYSSVVPDFDKFKSLLGAKKTFVAVKQYQLWASDSDVSSKELQETLTINNITNENGIVLIDGILTNQRRVGRFQLANFTDTQFSIGFKDGDTFYNVVISLGN